MPMHKSAIGPAPQAVMENSEAEQNAYCIHCVGQLATSLAATAISGGASFHGSLQSPVPIFIIIA